MNRAEWAERFSISGIFLLLGGIFWAGFPAPMSMGSGLLLLGGLMHPQKRKPGLWLYGLLALWMMAAFSYFWSDDTHEWSILLQRKMSLWLAGVGMALFPWEKRHTKWMLLTMMGMGSIVLVGTLYRYAIDFENRTQEVFHSKGVPIMGGLSHIYFTVYLACGTLLGLYYFLCRTPGTQIFQWIGLCWGISIHILASRTGWLSLYGGIIVLLFYTLYRNHKKWFIIGMSCLVVFPIVAWMTIPSLQQKIKNTLVDLHNYRNGLHIGHYSLSMRFTAWEASWDIFMQHPWTGVGEADLKVVMNKWYDQRSMHPDARISESHNQWLQLLATNGITGVLFLFIYIFGWQRMTYRKPLAKAWFIAVFLALLFESMMEVQSGMCFLSVAPILSNLFGDEE